MNIPSTLRRRRSEEGVVAIELASVLFLFILLLSLLLFWARVFWYYSMAHKAAHDAARYLSRATPAEIQTFGSGYSEAPAAGVARWIIESELGVLRPLMRPMWVYVECGARNGTGSENRSLPANVPASLTQAQMRDSIFYERKIELAFEGKRWFDLVRRGFDVWSAAISQDPTATDITQKRMLWPIPQPQIDLNHALTQNPGY